MMIETLSVAIKTLAHFFSSSFDSPFGGDRKGFSCHQNPYPFFPSFNFRLSPPFTLFFSLLFSIPVDGDRNYFGCHVV
jgi:hypothetical protein